MVKTKAEVSIEKAFVELYRKKELSAITVKEICQAAGLSRATFYTYFEDIHSLLSDIEESVMSDISDILKTWEYYDLSRIKKDTPISLYVDCYRYVNRNRRVYQALLGPYGRHDFVIRYNNKIWQDYVKKIAFYEIHTSNADMLASMCAGSVIYTSRAWVFDEFQAEPEEVALMTTKAIIALLNCEGNP